MSRMSSANCAGPTSGILTSAAYGDGSDGGAGTPGAPLPRCRRRPGHPAGAPSGRGPPVPPSGTHGPADADAPAMGASEAGAPDEGVPDDPGVSSVWLIQVGLSVTQVSRLSSAMAWYNEVASSSAIT